MTDISLFSIPSDCKKKKKIESCLNASLFTSYVNKTDLRDKNNCNTKKLVSLVQHHVYNISQ